MSTIKNYLGWLALIALLGWTALIIVFYRLDPFTSTALALPFFFVALFLALSTSLALIGFYSRVWWRAGEIYFGHIGIALRQGVLIALAVDLALGLQIFRALTWWDGLLIAAAIGLVEVYFASQD